MEVKVACSTAKANAHALHMARCAASSSGKASPEAAASVSDWRKDSQNIGASPQEFSVQKRAATSPCPREPRGAQRLLRAYALPLRPKEGPAAAFPVVHPSPVRTGAEIQRSRRCACCYASFQTPIAPRAAGVVRRTANGRAQCEN